jgi:spore germination cell wall hydrolase CwlJ-like protein
MSKNTTTPEYILMNINGGGIMPVVRASSSDISLMARLLRAEAEGEG